MERKRSHSLEGAEGEKLFPATKQSKIEDFFALTKMPLKEQSNPDYLEAACANESPLRQLSPKVT